MAVETKLNLEAETLEAIHDLLQMNVDSREGFEYAAEKVDNMALKGLFEKLATQRREQADELANYLEVNLEEPSRKGSYAASVHRTWLAVREACTSNNAYAVLAEAERGEDYIKAAYEDALKKIPGSAMQDVLMAQFKQVKEAHDRVRDLRDELKD